MPPKSSYVCDKCKETFLSKKYQEAHNCPDPSECAKLKQCDTCCSWMAKSSTHNCPNKTVPFRKELCEKHLPILQKPDAEALMINIGAQNMDGSNPVGCSPQKIRETAMPSFLLEDKDHKPMDFLFCSEIGLQSLKSTAVPDGYVVAEAKFTGGKQTADPAAFVFNRNDWSVADSWKPKQSNFASFLFAHERKDVKVFLTGCHLSKIPTDTEELNQMMGFVEDAQSKVDADLFITTGDTNRNENVLKEFGTVVYRSSLFKKGTSVKTVAWWDNAFGEEKCLATASTFELSNLSHRTIVQEWAWSQ